MASTFIFPGTPRERRDLAAAVAHNCTCFVEDDSASEQDFGARYYRRGGGAQGGSHGSRK